MPAMVFQKRLFQAVLALDLVGLCFGAIVQRVEDLPGLEYDFIVVGGMCVVRFEAEIPIDCWIQAVRRVWLLQTDSQKILQLLSLCLKQEARKWYMCASAFELANTNTTVSAGMWATLIRWFLSSTVNYSKPMQIGIIRPCPKWAWAGGLEATHRAISLVERAL